MINQYRDKGVPGWQKLFQATILPLGRLLPGIAASAIGLSILSPLPADAQSAPPNFIPTDVTPFTVTPTRNELSPGYKFRIFQKLPERLRFNATTEVSQRLDTNVFFTSRNAKADYVFRVLPNVTLGYDLWKNTSVYANYFVIKDVFSEHPVLSFPTTQSLSWGIQHNKQLTDKTTLQFDFQARELWLASHLRFFDFLPNATITHVFNPSNIGFFSTLLQLRGSQYFVSPNREIDPFYTLGYIHRMGQWNFVLNDTFVTNYRHPPFNKSIPRQSNLSMIGDIEVNHPIVRRIPGMVAFLRAEPVWNWDSHYAPGLSGFDFRLYGGVRIAIDKPSYYSGMENLRKQIMQSESQSPPVPNSSSLEQTNDNSISQSDTAPAKTSSKPNGSSDM